MDRKTRTETRTKTVTVTKADVRRAIREGRLTEEEERYVRIRFGLSEPPAAPLPRRGQAFEETRAKIALMEAEILGDALPPVRDPLKERIIKRLRET